LPSLTLRGIGVPDDRLTVLQDGAALAATTLTDSEGNFIITIPSLAEGTYSFTIEETDGSGHPISSYTTTFTVILGTTNSITGIVLPPSVTLATSTVGLGKPALISGLAAPSSTIQLWTTSQSNLQTPVLSTTTADQSGNWSYMLKTTGFPADTYQEKARSLLPGFSASAYSSIAYLGIGKSPVPNVLIGDLNGDGKVNLVDFSIMLVHWGTDYPPAELSGDSTVGLRDLSILLAHWTG
jgi:hypothetical protein